MTKFDFIEQKDNKVIAKKKVTLVVPKQMFEDRLAETLDTNIQTLGFFVFEVEETPEKVKRYQVNLPVLVSINAFTAITRQGGDVAVSYDVGDVIIESTTYFKRVDAVNKFLNYLIAAKIEVSDPEELIDLFQKNAAMNDTRLSSQPAVVEALVSELVRWKQDETVPLRLALKGKGVDRKEFKLISIKEISRVTSVFNAISFEDINRSLQSAVLMSRQDKQQSESPVEKVLHY